MFRRPFPPSASPSLPARPLGPILICAALASLSTRAWAHGMSEASSQHMADGGVLDHIWLGAEHMVTGYDHLLFLFGVIFFLTGFRDVVRFITAFTIGHCITLLGATLAGITANAHLIDAVIALSVIYKGFENLGGFEKTLHIRPPNLLTMVFVFGLIHGFGLSTRLQELTLGGEGLVGRILAFNVGVELGQVAALAVMLVFFRAWRATSSFDRLANLANVGLVLAGAALFVHQIHGYTHEAGHTDHAEPAPVAEHEHPVEHAHEAERVPEATEATEATPDKAPVETPPKTDHGHSHSHTHETVTPAAEEPAEPAATQKSSHSHGSGRTHSH